MSLEIKVIKLRTGLYYGKILKLDTYGQPLGYWNTEGYPSRRPAYYAAYYMKQKLSGMIKWENDND